MISSCRTGDLHDALDDLVQQTALLRVCRAVVDLLAVAAADEQAALRQGAQMVRHGRAGHLQHGGQIDDACLLMAEQPENAHARRVAELLEHLGCSRKMRHLHDLLMQACRLRRRSVVVWKLKFCHSLSPFSVLEIPFARSETSRPNRLHFGSASSILQSQRLSKH